MNKLQIQRVAQNLTQAELAEISEVNIRMIQYYEQKVKDIDNASYSTLLKLAIALDCRIEDIIENDALIELINTYENNR